VPGSPRVEVGVTDVRGVAVTASKTAHAEVTMTGLQGAPTAWPLSQPAPEGQQQNQPTIASLPVNAAGVIASLLGTRPSSNIPVEPVVDGLAHTTSAVPSQLEAYLVGLSLLITSSGAATDVGTTYSLTPSGNVLYVDGSSVSAPSAPKPSSISQGGIATAASGGLDPVATESRPGVLPAVTEASGTARVAVESSVRTSAVGSDSAAAPPTGTGAASSAVQTPNMAAGLVLLLAALL
jgi:hypothetical protein